MSPRELKALEATLTKRMRVAAAELNFEEAIKLRDRLSEIHRILRGD